MLDDLRPVRRVASAGQVDGLCQLGPLRADDLVANDGLRAEIDAFVSERRATGAGTSDAGGSA